MNERTVELRGNSYTGEVTNMDALFMAGLLLPDYFEIKENEQDLRASFAKFSERNAELLQNSDKDDETLADEMFNAWGERLLIRLTTNLDIRSAFSQRIKEIFPAIPASLIKFERYRDRDGNVHEDSSVRLNVEEAMALVVAMVSVLYTEDEDEKPTPEAEATPAKTKRPSGKGFAKPAELPVKDPSRNEQIEALKAQLAQLEAVTP